MKMFNWLFKKKQPHWLFSGEGDQRITLPWMNLLRKRLKEYNETSGYLNIWGETEEINDFIQPILDYGNQEEIRLTKSFHKGRDCKCDVCKEV